MDTYHSIILSEIETVDLDGLGRYGWENRELIPYLYSIGSLGEDEIRDAIVKNVRRTAQDDFDLLLRDGKYHNIKRPEVLAYFLPKICDPEYLPSAFREFKNNYWKPNLIETLTRELLEPSMPENV